MHSSHHVNGKQPIRSHLHTPARRCLNSTCCPGCWGPRRAPGPPSSHRAAADPARAGTGTNTAPPGHRRCVNARESPSGLCTCQQLLFNCKHKNSPGVWLRCFLDVGFIGSRFREVQGSFGLLLLQELEGQLAPLDWAPEGRHDIFTLQTGHFPTSASGFLSEVTQQHTLLERNGEQIKHVRRRQTSFRVKLLSTEALMQLENKSYVGVIIQKLLREERGAFTANARRGGTTRYIMRTR